MRIPLLDFWQGGVDPEDVAAITLILGRSPADGNIHEVTVDSVELTINNIDPYCGNEVAEGDEVCDYFPPADESCLDYGFIGGDLGCSSACLPDTSACIAAVCGNGVVEGDEECDDGNVNPYDDCNPDCTVCPAGEPLCRCLGSQPGEEDPALPFNGVLGDGTYCNDDVLHGGLNRCVELVAGTQTCIPCSIDQGPFCPCDFGNSCFVDYESGLDTDISNPNAPADAEMQCSFGLKDPIAPGGLDPALPQGYCFASGETEEQGGAPPWFLEWYCQSWHTDAFPMFEPSLRRSLHPSIAERPRGCRSRLARHHRPDGSSGYPRKVTAANRHDLDARVDEIFDRALDVPTNERSTFLDQACDNEDLRARVERLLAFSDDPPSVLDSAAVTDLWRPEALEADAEAESDRPQRVGPYRILEEIGRGGMGVVYLAERADGHFEQRVAVKVMRPGSETPEARRGFEQERQIIASLQHASIARLYDGGVTEGGRPYSAMEWVEGKPITRYCDEQRLPLAARLRLVEEVASAVHYAHQNLVVHCDLKPSNILVTADGEIKLLDFGIAKLLDVSGDDPLSNRRSGPRAITPLYASPEQLRGEPVTTASDVYQLGLLLFELLTGERGREVSTAAGSRASDEPSDPATRAGTEHRRSPGVGRAGDGDGRRPRHPPSNPRPSAAQRSRPDRPGGHALAAGTALPIGGRVGRRSEAPSPQPTPERAPR